jgi:nicotinate-nucleotide adenylyltransferase
MWEWPVKIALLGGSFNPAHRAHRRISLAALEQLQVDAVWWLVSPGNPLKPKVGMAPLAARYTSALAASRRARIKPTTIEHILGTRYTVDTLAKLIQRYPRYRFIWLMGADNLAQFHAWRDWRKIARLLPIAVFARPGYTMQAQRGPAWAWLRQFVRPQYQSAHWTQWSSPALVSLRTRLDPMSATRLRARNPDWHRHVRAANVRDRVTRRPV